MIRNLFSATNANLLSAARETIFLGLYSSADRLRRDLEANQCWTNSRAENILNKITLSSVEISLDLVFVTVGELGFTSRVTIKDIYSAALTQELELCPPEVGPQLRIKYNDRRADGWLWIGMKPVHGLSGDGEVFCVVFDRRLIAEPISRDRYFNINACFVFVLPRQ
jgi:hypothetical protein